MGGNSLMGGNSSMGGNSLVRRDLAWGLEGHPFKKSMMWTDSWRMVVHMLGIAGVPLSKAPTPNTARWAP